MIFRLLCRKNVRIFMTSIQVLVLAIQLHCIAWEEALASEPSSQILLSEPDVVVCLSIEGIIPFEVLSGASHHNITLKVTEARESDVVSATCSILELSHDEDVEEAARHPICSFALSEGHSIDLTPIPGILRGSAHDTNVIERSLVRFRYPQYIPPCTNLEIRRVTALVDTRCSLRNGTLYRSETEVHFSMLLPTPDGISEMKSHTRGLLTKSGRTEEETNNLRALLFLPSIASALSDEDLLQCLQRLEINKERELRKQLLSLLARTRQEIFERYRNRIRTDTTLECLFDLRDTPELWDDSYNEPLLAKFEDTTHPRVLTTILELLHRHVDRVPRARLTAALRNNGLIPSPDLQRPPSPARMRTVRRLRYATTGSQLTKTKPIDHRSAGGQSSVPSIFLARPTELVEVSERTVQLSGAGLCSMLALAGDVSTIALLTPLLEDQRKFGAFILVGQVEFPATRTCDRAHDAILEILGLDHSAAIAIAYHQTGIQNSLSPLSPRNIVPTWQIASDEWLARQPTVATDESEQIIIGTTVSQPTFTDANGEVLTIRNQMLKNLTNELQNSHIKGLLEKSR